MRIMATLLVLRSAEHFAGGEEKGSDNEEIVFGGPKVTLGTTIFPGLVIAAFP